MICRECHTENNYVFNATGFKNLKKGSTQKKPVRHIYQKWLVNACIVQQKQIIVKMSPGSFCFEKVEYFLAAKKVSS